MCVCVHVRACVKESAFVSVLWCVYGWVGESKSALEHVRENVCEL